MIKDTTTLEKLRKIFVSHEIFNLRVNPLEKVVYTLLAAILLGFLGVVINFFIRLPK